MASRQAMASIKGAIAELNHLEPITRDDNLALLDQLEASTRKAFFRARLHLAKLAATGSCTNDIIGTGPDKVRQANAKSILLDFAELCRTVRFKGEPSWLSAGTSLRPCLRHRTNQVRASSIDPGFL